jgi:haloalkane dehalogenase
MRWLRYSKAMAFSNHPYGQPERFLNLSSASLPYWKLGSGPDLVFVHGWPIDSRTFRRAVSLLSPNYTCHLIDLPGAGLSRWSPHTGLNFGEFPRAVAEALQQMDLGDGKFVFVGHDSGGGVARLAIHHLKDRVAGYVLGNTEIPADYSPLFRRLFTFGKTPLVKPAFQVLCHLRLTRQLFCLGRSWAGSQLEAELGELFVDPLIRFPGKLDAALTLLRNAKVTDFDALAEAHGQIEVPVRLVWGDRDPWFPLSAARGMLDTFNGPVSLRVVEKASLLVHEEAPEIFCAEVESFFSEV